jgi:hypothetical protein
MYNSLNLEGEKEVNIRTLNYVNRIVTVFAKHKFRESVVWMLTQNILP